MFEKQQRKLKRSARLIRVLTKYGFQDLLIRISPQLEKSHEKDQNTTTHSVYERVRLALEELGPTFVKLGQALSDREDLLPIELIQQLRHLQDRVVTLDLDINSIMTEEFGQNVALKFKHIDPIPLAAASIAQVYKGKFFDGSSLIIKVKRPGIDAIIEDDILILKDLVDLIDTYSELAEQVNLKAAVIAFEKSLLEELSLKNERLNLLEFHKNFSNNEETHVPKVYTEFCSDNILTMEFIDGIKVTDIDKLRENNIDPVKIAEIGYRLFVSQILDFGFFHADPHAGNLLVNKQGKLIFIDFGAVGKIPQSERNLFENLILAFMTKKAAKIVRTLKKLALFYKIPDQRRFEMEVLDILNYVHNSSLNEINVVEIMDKMKDILKDNRLVMPEYFYLLFKGISLMDGVGRQLNPNLDVVNSLKPYTKKIFLRRLNPEYIAQESIKKTTDLVDHLEEIPKELRSLLSKLEENQFSIQTDLSQYSKFEKLVKSSVINIILSLILAANIITTGLIINSGFILLIFSSCLLSLILVIVLLLRLFRR